MARMNQLQLNQEYEEEATLLAKAKEWLAGQPDVLCMRVCDRYHKGYSDLILCVDGVFVAAELKDNKGTPSAHQKLFTAEVIRHGGIAKADVKTLQQIIDLVEEARAWKTSTR